MHSVRRKKKLYFIWIKGKESRLQRNGRPWPIKTSKGDVSAAHIFTNHGPTKAVTLDMGAAGLRSRPSLRPWVQLGKARAVIPALDKAVTQDTSVVG
ncbi:hypothetical protein Pyn_17630 [Prunus yedoensis var. nudiflora]|uniref:Uncharacterized protein n=1 Tax=Prunus yedoensis var. nudiflora TaxID=2094558 RepID=A0A314U9B3_PRUYE|nr:hypothetical protein Pyn_17630 [Prunus yedoensis var. nudiflora]